MDIQFILDEYSCAAYVAEYVNKSARGFSSLYRELIKLRDEFPDMDYELCLKELGHRTLNNIEMCAQEAAWFLLRLPMSESSRIVTYIPTQHPSERFLSRKKYKQMEEEGLGEDSTNIWQQNIIQVYEERPVSLETLCLADFVANYDQVRHRKIATNLEENVTTNETDHNSKRSNEKFRKRSKPKVLRWRSYKASDDLLNYKREMVTLFCSFRNEEIDILNNDAYIGLFDNNKVYFFNVGNNTIVNYNSSRLNS